MNIGGSSTGIAREPPVGAGIIKKTTAAGLMTFFLHFSMWIIGPSISTVLAYGFFLLVPGVVR